jgi:predicted ATPase/class 3 adenylate cyclase/Tfp pilus assembly protein PilF
MADLPSGTVTFLFTDIEGSTKLWEQHPDAMRAALQRHDDLLRQAFEQHSGYTFKTVGDAFCVAFRTAQQALDATIAGQRSLHSEHWNDAVGSVRVRMALHTGTIDLQGGDYYGQPVNRVARLLSAGHGGQTLLSEVTYGLVRDSLPAGVLASDMGEHRLKDLYRPERIFQLVIQGMPSEFSPLKTLDNRPNNLPVQLTPVIGRENETKSVYSLLRKDEVRLVTLTGPGGTGKTRLALQSAAEMLDDFEGGIYFVDLAPITDEDLVVSTISQTLGVKEVGGEALLDTLKAYLKEKAILLVLDNFEQVVGAAPDIGRLLVGCPSVKVLATSRVPLRIRGEKEYPVPPLSLPNVGRLGDAVPNWLTQYESVRLFIERVADIKPDFQVTNDNAPAVAEICVRLDGLPLAIELAASRIRLLTPQAMLSRLSNRLKLLTGGAKDAAARQRTLRSTLDWSYDLLDPGEKQLFRRLSVFQGGRTLEAIEEVCNANGDLQIDGLEGVEALVANSLLRQEEGAGGEPRFAMLETIHEYAREKLQESGEAEALGSKHALYFMRLAEEAEPHLSGDKQKEWLNRLSEEQDNIRMALKWARGESEKGKFDAIEIGLRLVGALWRFWHVSGLLKEGREELEGALSWGGIPGEGVRGKPAVLKRARAKALQGAGVLAYGQGDNAAAQSRLEECLTSSRELGDQVRIANVLSSLGHIANVQEDQSKARALYEEALAIFRELEDKQGIASTLSNLGDVAMAHGDYAAARVLFEESLAIDRELGDKSAVATKLCSFGVAAMQTGRFADASLHYGEALEIFRQLEDKRGIARTLGELGWLAQSQGNLPSAQSLFQESLATYRGLGHKQGISSSLAGLGAVASDQGNYAEARMLFEESLAIDRELGDKWGLTVRLNNLGAVAMMERNYSAARSYYEEGMALARGLGLGTTRFFPVWLVSSGHATILAGDYSAARSHYAEGMRLGQTLGDAGIIMQCLVGLGGVVAIGSGQAKTGAKLLGVSEAMVERFGARLRYEDQLVYDQVLSLIRAQLGEETYERARNEGLQMSIDEAVRYALEES